MARANTRQRSWDNYVGDDPIKSWKESGFYSNSPTHRIGGDEDFVPEGYERDPKKGLRKKRNSALEESTPPEAKPKKLPKSKLGKALGAVRGFDLNEDSATDGKPSFGSESPRGPVRTETEKDDGSMLPPGYRINEKGQVENSAGYIEPDDWYTIDEATGLKRRKTLKERPMYDGGRAV